MHILRIAWDRWKIMGRVNGDTIGRLTTVVFYYTILVPFALGAQRFVDPLQLKRGTGWLNRKPVSASIEAARSQF